MHVNKCEIWIEFSCPHYCGGFFYIFSGQIKLTCYTFCTKNGLREGVGQQ